MKLTFKWLDYADNKRVWQELTFAQWDDPVPGLGHAIVLTWVKNGEPVQLKSWVKEVRWSLNVSDGGALNTSVLIHLGD